MYDCFISYKVEADDNVAFQLSRLLQDNDFKVFVDKKSLLPGQNWADELQHSVTQSNYVFAIFTQDYIARVVEGNCNGDNFIIEELNWALKDNKLIPIGIGVTVEEIATCFDLVPSLKPIQFQMFPTDLSEQCFHIILNKLYKRIYLKDSKAKSIIPVSHPVNVSGTALSSEDAYLKLDMPWKADEAIKYKEELEGKFLKDSMDYVVLAKFYLKGAFGLEISPELAYQHLKKSALNNCREAFFELGVLFQYADNIYGGDEDKATEYYTKAHKLGDIRATYQLAELFDESIENINCPTQFLKNKYGIEHSNQFITDILLKKDRYSALNAVEKHIYCLAKIDANENKESAVEEIHKLASLGSLTSVRWLGFEYSKSDGNVVQNTQQCLTYLHAGEEQGDLFCRRLLACIYLESEYRELGFDQNIELGIKKHQRNINLNYYHSAYSLARVIANQPGLGTYVRIEQQILFLEQAVVFGQLNCADILVELYLSTNHPTLVPFILDTGAKGNFTPLVGLITSSGHLNIRDLVEESDYKKLYQLSIKAYDILLSKGDSRGSKKILEGLKYFSLFYNKIEDALAVLKIDKYCDYSDFSKLIQMHRFLSKTGCIFKILKKGAKTGCNNCNDWLLMIILGLVNKELKPFVEVENFDEQFWVIFLQYNLNNNFNTDSTLLFINDAGTHDSIKLYSKYLNSAIKLIIFSKQCEKQLITPNVKNSVLLDLYRKLITGEFFEIKHKSLPANNLYKTPWKLEDAYYKRLVLDVENRNDLIMQSALCIHVISLFQYSSLDKNEKHFNWCIKAFTHNYSTSDSTLLGEFVGDFSLLYQMYFSKVTNKTFGSYHQNAEIIISVLKQLVLHTFDGINEKHALFGLMGDAQKRLFSEGFSDFRGTNLTCNRLLFEIIYIRVTINPQIDIENYIYLFKFYSFQKNFKCREIPDSPALPHRVRKKMLKAANKGDKTVQDIIQTPEFVSFMNSV